MKLNVGFNTNLGVGVCRGGGSNFTPHPTPPVTPTTCLFSTNNSEKVKAVSLAFCNILF